MERKIGKLLQETEFGMPLEHRQKQFNLDFQGAYDLRQIDIKHLKDARWDPTSLWTGALQDHKLNWDQLD